MQGWSWRFRVGTQSEEALKALEEAEATLEAAAAQAARAFDQAEVLIPPGLWVSVYGRLTRPRWGAGLVLEVQSWDTECRGAEGSGGGEAAAAEAARAFEQAQVL